jgi:hypothetical protein
MSNPACELEKLRAELAATKAELAQARAVVSTFRGDDLRSQT